MMRPRNYIPIATMLTAVLVAPGCAKRASVAEEKEAEALSSPEVTAGGAGEETRFAAQQEKASFVTEIAFKPGSQFLNDEARQKLADTLKKAYGAGEVDTVEVLSWADEEYPSVHTKRLPEAQRELAENRNEEIQRFFEANDGSIDVDTYSMAERPSALAETANTKAAKIKRALELGGIPTTSTAVKVPSKASKALVMVIMKE